MAAPGKQTSRWGSFLSQAVAGVEARLDTILAENDDTSGQPKETKLTPSSTSTPIPASPSKQSPAPSRTASTSRTNDRLQERLARAMAAKSAAAAQKADASAPRTSVSTQGSPRPSIDTPSRASTESVDRPSQAPKEEPKEALSLRISHESTRKSLDIAPEEANVSEVVTNGAEDALEKEEEATGARGSADIPPRVATPAGEASVVEATLETSPKTNEREDPDDSGDRGRAVELEKQYQEEIHGYVERIDALEAKLQYLTKETTESARKAALAAPAGGAEIKLAEKDQQIAQLMEEGKNLASTEQKHRAILKKLRSKIAEDEKALNSLKAAKDKSDKELDSLRLRVRQAGELEKTNNDLQKRLDQSQKELNTVRPEIRSKDNIIAELKAQLQKANEQADAMSLKVNDWAREQDRRRIAELEDSVAALQVEKNLVADRSRTQVNELKEKAERANERSRALELELKAEVQVMESKLEAMRVRAEEASSGAMGDSQAKLLRQVETLQSQYSIASENWQGIETTLRGRIANLERERDDALQRESDMRKKAREAAIRAKRNEEELEDTKTRLPNIQQDVEAYQTQFDALKKRAEEAEAALVIARAEFEKQKQAWEAEKDEKQLLLSRGTPADRRSWLEDLPGSGPFLRSDNSRPESPQLSAPPRTFSSDFLGIQSLSNKIRKVSAPSSNGDPVVPGGAVGSFGHRRPSAQPSLVRPNMQSTGGSSVLFGPSALTFSPTTDQLLTPSSMTHPLDREQQQQQLYHRGEREPLERHDTFDSADTSSSPHQVLQDMVSVSTVAAGPSVQLVERMSAAIRRLESEKVAAREELARISKQRDEARAEIVALMRDAESGKQALKRVAELEAEVAEVNERYETTLEMLGEKSELVDELKADVEDVKTMYRDLVERTIK